LQQNAKERAELAATAVTSSTTNFTVPATASKMSTQELEELRKQLGSVTTGSTLQQVPWPSQSIGDKITAVPDTSYLRMSIIYLNESSERPRLDYALQSGILNHKNSLVRV
jgi:hypothetical protein